MTATDRRTVAAGRVLMPLLVTQFFGAFNDNAFKMIVVLLGMAAVQGDDEVARQAVATTAFVAMTLPLMLGSLPAMVLGDRVSKRSLVVGTKFVEVCLMATATAVLWLDPDGWLPFLVLAGMGLQSALFAPGKYGLLPELLQPELLPRANGRIEAASFLAIILGTVAGGVLLEHVDAVWIAAAVLTVLSVVGFLASLALPRVLRSGGGESTVSVVRGAWTTMRCDRRLGRAMCGSAVFWALASLLGQDVLVYGKQQLQFSDDLAALPFALFAIGIGAGSLLAGRLSRGHAGAGLIPIGALGIAGGTVAMGVFEPGRLGTFAGMFELGVASGLVVVPLNASVQLRAPAARRGAVIALVNLVSFGGMLLGNFVCLGLAAIGCDAARILLCAGVLASFAVVWAARVLAAECVRSVAAILSFVLFRSRLVGCANVPRRGGALLVSNHVSFLDGLLLLGATGRPIRFVIDRYWFERPLLRPLLGAIGAIPICADEGPRVVLRALRDAGEALDRGELVCIFAEGEISRMGSTLPFRRGMQRLVRRRRAVIVPVHLDRVYGALGSIEQGRMRWVPTRLCSPVTISFGEPMPNDSAPARVREVVEQLGERAVRLRSDELEALHAPFVRRVRRAPWRACLADSQGRRLSRIQTLTAALLLARRCADTWRDQPHVGVLLPPSIGGALAAIGLSLAGRAAVPLNYTVGAAALRSAIRQAQLRTVLTSRAFLERLPAESLCGLEDVELVLLEDVLAAASRGERVGNLLRALLLPLSRLERAAGSLCRVRADDVAAVLFSSGSTGDPKGVVLSHGNVQANVRAVAQIVPFSPRDRLAAVLPLFHSFGNMALWYVLEQGAAIAFHPNPLDALAVGELVARHRATALIATPTFLQLYLRRVAPGSFGSLRLVLAGAEKLGDELADAFHDRFGLRPVQGYGATECAPAIAVSAPGFRAAGFYQAGTRRGSVGRPLPGVGVLVVDPESFEPVPDGVAGLLLVRGANVMQGYLGRDDLTAEVMRDGYYVTGDIGRLDPDGFLFLTDRLSRFSKVGGEMVPHGTVEEHLQAVYGGAERVFAVTGVPDARKGERLVVLTTLQGRQLEQVVAGMQRRGLPALFVPRRRQFVVVDELPLLGTGKLDLRGVRELAMSRSEVVDAGA